MTYTIAFFHSYMRNDKDTEIDSTFIKGTVISISVPVPPSKNIPEMKPLEEINIYYF